MIEVLLAVAAPMGASWDWSFRANGGLQIAVAETPWVRGSWFQVYEPDWSKGYLNSQSATSREIERSPTRAIVEYGAEGAPVRGRVSVERVGDEVTHTVSLKWTGDHELRAEICHGMVWAPATDLSRLTIDGRPSRRGSQPMAANDYQTRRIGTPGGTMQFAGPLGQLIAEADSKQVILFDAVGYDQPWARPRQVLWMGEVDVVIPTNSEVSRTVRWRVAEPRGSLGDTREVPGRFVDATVVKAPPRRMEDVIPKPKESRLDQRLRVPIALSGERDPRFAEFSRLLRLLWDIDASPRSQTWTQEITPEITHPEGYEIRIGPTANDVVLRARTPQGMTHAQRTLALLAHPSQGTLTLPTGTLKDSPSLDWRGVHLFVGPTALELHRRLFGSVLSLYKVNHAVLQCERTAWRSQPSIRTAMTMPLDDLVAEFEMLRNEFRVEPIPLIQSWGHMGWLFENGQNRQLAWNAETPFAIDPRSAEARQAIQSIWDEAIDVLRPKTIHFGLDEVNLRGGPDEPALITELWKAHVGWLSSYARDRAVEPMFWSDMMLAPSEAIDATHGDTLSDAEARRAALPPQAWIADWHYRADPNPAGFRVSLDLWKRLGMRPVAAGWYRPENIRGLTHAAIDSQAGYLQTTWAGYESNLANLTRDLFQFSAMILALDYAWSGREELPSRLPYDPIEVFVRRFFLGPRAVSAQAGRQLVSAGQPDAPTLQTGDWVFRNLTRVNLGSTLWPDGGPKNLKVRLESPLLAREIVLGASTGFTCNEGETVAMVRGVLNGKVIWEAPIQYGRQVRALNDIRYPYVAERDPGGPCAAVFTFDEPLTFDGFEFEAVSPYAGLRLHGISTRR